MLAPIIIVEVKYGNLFLVPMTDTGGLAEGLDALAETMECANPVPRRTALMDLLFGGAVAATIVSMGAISWLRGFDEPSPTYIASQYQTPAESLGIFLYDPQSRHRTQDRLAQVESMVDAYEQGTRLLGMEGMTEQGQYLLSDTDVAEAHKLMSELRRPASASKRWSYLCRHLDDWPDEASLTSLASAAVIGPDAHIVGMESKALYTTLRQLEKTLGLAGNDGAVQFLQEATGRAWPIEDLSRIKTIQHDTIQHLDQYCHLHEVRGLTLAINILSTMRSEGLESAMVACEFRQFPKISTVLGYMDVGYEAIAPKGTSIPDMPPTVQYHALRDEVAKLRFSSQAAPAAPLTPIGPRGFC